MALDIQGSFRERSAVYCAPKMVLSSCGLQVREARGTAPIASTMEPTLLLPNS